MNGKNGPVMDKAHPELLVPPHILHKLIDVVSGEWQPDPFQLEQLAAHLAECSYCRIGLILLLSAEKTYEKQHNDLDTSVSKLLEQVFTIDHEIEAWNYEYMGAYAEAIVAVGREKAEQRFPILTKHIKTCPVCQTRLEETLTFLNEFKEGS